ncbi:CocE/NonD family hydrolase [Microlunatus sp. GCM10028923]|uniref:CocE/NonD family hydrolase n=1 Tax=Microlunatus sp. GCM10028923 TaxID=3273400 RepID=UPI00360C2F4C
MSMLGRIGGRLLGLPPVRSPKIMVERGLEIPAGDGVTLLADRYYPVADPRAPLLLFRTPYGRGSANVLISRLYAERGYQVLIQSLRGTDGSGGTFDGFAMNRADGPATIAWLREQPWFPGVFGSFGASYLGYAQWDLASTPIPEWRVAIMDVAPSDFYHSFMYVGGAFALGNALAWTQLVHSLMRDGTSTNPSTMSALTAGRTLARACAELPIARADEAATGSTVPYFQDWIAHEHYDEFWARMDYRDNVDNLPPVVHLGGGWPDFFLRNTLDDHARILASGRTVRLFVSAAQHGRNMTGRQYLRDVFTVLDHAFGSRSLDSVPAVRLQVAGRKHWRSAEQWPVPHQPVTWYLQGNGGLAPEGAGASPASLLRYDPEDPTPTVGGTMVGLGAGARDNRKIEARPDVLTFTSTELADDHTMIGPVAATIHVRSSLVDTDVFVRICDVHPGGRSLNVSDGILRLTDQNAPADDDGIRVAQVELWPVGHVFRRGHRIRVQVSGGAHPRFVRNLGTAEPLATATTLRAARQEIFHDSVHPSAVVLPLAARDA